MGVSCPFDARFLRESRVGTETERAQICVEMTHRENNCVCATPESNLNLGNFF